MKVVVFLISLVIFVAGLVAFGYAFALEEPFNMALFAGGIIAVGVALGIPMHVLQRLD